MRILINYLRECFCKHLWKREEEEGVEVNGTFSTQVGTRVSATCEKCGYHKSYWKFL